MVARTLSISGSAPEFGEIEARPAGNAIASDPSKGEGIRFARDLYGALPVKRLFLGSAASSLFGAGKAVLHPVACDQVPGARGRGQGTETLAQLGGLPP